MIFLRKSHYVHTVNHKDIDFLNALRCSGVCTRSQATQFISANRHKNFILDRTLEKCSHTLPNGKRQEVYRITTEGKTWIKANIDSLADRKYYSSTGVQHDIQLMDKILTLSREERSTMRCEAEIRDEFKERLQELLLNREYERYDQLYNAILLCDKKKVLYRDKAVDAFIRISSTSEQTSNKLINIRPKELTRVSVKATLNKESFDFTKTNRIYMEYQDEKQKTHKVLLKMY